MNPNSSLSPLKLQQVDLAGTGLPWTFEIEASLDVAGLRKKLLPRFFPPAKIQGFDLNLRHSEKNPGRPILRIRLGNPLNRDVKVVTTSKSLGNLGHASVLGAR